MLNYQEITKLINKVCIYISYINKKQFTIKYVSVLANYWPDQSTITGLHGGNCTS